MFGPSCDVPVRVLPSLAGVHRPRQLIALHCPSYRGNLPQGIASKPQLYSNMTILLQTSAPLILISLFIQLLFFIHFYPDHGYTHVQCQQV